MKSMDRLNSANRIVISTTKERLNHSLFFVLDILMLFLLYFRYFYLTIIYSKSLMLPSKPLSSIRNQILFNPDFCLFHNDLLINYYILFTKGWALYLILAIVLGLFNVFSTTCYLFKWGLRWRVFLLPIKLP